MRSGTRQVSLKKSLLAALAFGAAAISAIPSAAGQEILTYKGPDRETKLIEGAKKEGQVVLYSTAIVNQALRPLADAFMQKYPFVKLTYWRGDTDVLMGKVNAELRANNPIADVLEGSLGEDAIEAKAAQPFYSPMIEAFPQDYRDPQGYWIPTRLNYYSLAYNTKLVPRDLVPKTYLDLLDPRWKGKMAWPISVCCGDLLFITNLRKAWGEDRAADYLGKLATQKIVNFGSGSARTLVDRVMAGEYPIALQIFAHHPLISAAQGAPVASQLLDPVPSNAAEVLVSRMVPHPYSALLLIDFLLSREGQATLAKAEYFPARPDVEALPSIEPVVPSRAGMRENFVDPAELYKETGPSQKIFEQLFR